MPMRMRILLSMKYCAICAELKPVDVGGRLCHHGEEDAEQHDHRHPRSHRDAIELKRAAHKWIHLNAAITLDAS
jgi:hypothetical protein